MTDVSRCGMGLRSGLRLAFWLLLGAALLPFSVRAEGFAAVAERLAAEGDAAVAAYDPADGFAVADAVSGLYFDVFEASGMEAAVGARDGARKSHLESRFGEVIGLAGRSADKPAVEAAWAGLRAELVAEGKALDGTDAGFWSLMLQAFLILLREGFEAILVVTALVAYLRRIGAPDKVRVVYHGVGWALAASLLAAWLLAAVFEISGAGREALEGVVMLVAAGVLAYVSHWLLARRDAARWQHYIRGQIDAAVSRGSLFTLGFAAFLAVFREGAETVLFYQALAAQATDGTLPLWIGFAVAAVALAGVYAALRNASQRLPLGLFFGATAVLLFVLAVSFAGGGILELQEAGWVGITPLAGWPRLPAIGLYPTLETVVAQLALAALSLAGATLLLRRRAAAVGA
jgi:high-affinity iron transporter